MSSKKCGEFSVTEEMWLRLRLDVGSLDRLVMTDTVISWALRWDGEIPHYKDIKILCGIASPVLGRVTEKALARDEAFERYEEWIAFEKSFLKEVLVSLPRLRKEIDIERDVMFEIRVPDGMSPRVVCSMRGEDVEWK